jgi:hypothetical protein
MPQPHRFVSGKRTQTDAVRAIARGQAGIVTRAQLLAAGIDSAVIGRALRARRLHHVYRGVYVAVAPELLTEEIGGRRCAALSQPGYRGMAWASAIAACPNCSGLSPETEPNPEQFAPWRSSRPGS